MFAQIFGLKAPSIAILQKAMNHLIEKQKEQTEPPTLEDLYQEVVTFSPRGRSEENSHVSVMNRLESVLDSELGHCLNVTVL